MTQFVLETSNWLGLDSVVDAIRDINKRFKRYNHYRHTVNELNSLSDKELNDIGLNRGMIHSVVMEMHYDNR